MRRIFAAAVMAVALGCSPSQQPSGPAKVTNAQLDPPPAGQGWQYAPAEFDVNPGTDLQRCYFYRVPGEGTEPVWVNKTVIAQNDGTHHMNIFRVKTIVGLDPADGDQESVNGVGPCFDSANWADWPLVVNSQVGGTTEWELPQGVAHRFEPGEMLMLQTHYVNAATQGTPGKGRVFVNFHTVPRSAVVHELGSLFATKQSIRICQNDAVSRFHGTCNFGSQEPVHIVGANGHFHSRGRTFEMFAWDGVSALQPPMSDRFYFSDEWYDPPMARSPELDRTVVAGGGIWYTCEFEWTPPPDSFSCDLLNAKDQEQLGTPTEAQDCCYTFGGPVDWAEHCNVFAYYYPKADNVLCY